LLLLQELDLTILNRPGRENVVADFLSQLENSPEEGLVDDIFPYEHLFVVSLQTPWFANIENYLVVGKFPRCFSHKEHCRIIKKSAHTVGFKGICSRWDLIMYSVIAYMRMKFMTCFLPVIMNHMEVIVPPKGLLLRFCC
jgi:hypothetical protein